MIEKMDMKSMDITEENVKKIQALFPNAVTEVIVDGKTTLKIDFDVLKQELSESLIEDKQERYQMTWPDKSKAKVLANSRITSTLRPDKEKSVDFDNTQNLYIEGDNLDVLKLLRETYLGKVKMIYIDPPYNTGNDFVYNDDFSQSADEYMETSGQYDEEGNRLVKNLESNGRFHTDWLNMIYPRLKVAKDLLTDDGAIFISIDDNEVDNLRKVCDEIFGKQNFVSLVIVQTNPRGRTFDKYIAKTHEYILVYVKDINKDCVFQVPKDSQAISQYQKSDEHGKYRLLELRNRNPVFNRSNRPKMFYPFYADPNTKTVRLQADDKHTVEIFPRNSEGLDGCWTWGLEKAKASLNLLVANHASTGKWTVFRKDYLEGDSLFTKSKALWLETEMNHEYGKEMVGQLFGNAPFDFPKSVDYIKKCLLIGTKKDSLVLDFFSGSATTAHAVMQLNAEDGGNRKFIMVQLPEECDEKSEAYKAGYKTICEIGEERIRRAGKKIQEENDKLKKVPMLEDKKDVDLFMSLLNKGRDTLEKGKELFEQADISHKIDTGFRVLKLDSSNMQDVYYNPNAMRQSLLDETIDNVKTDRTPLDLLFQIMLDLGVELSAKIEEKQVNGKTYFVVNGNDLIACFDEDIDNAVITEIAKQQPLYAVFKSTSFATDSASINNEQLFKTYSPATVIKVI